MPCKRGLVRRTQSMLDAIRDDTCPARLLPLQLLLPDCVCFSCCSRIASIRFNCCSPVASRLQLRLCPLQLLFPDCVRFSCCSPIASASAAVPRLRPLQLRLLSDCVRFNCFFLIASASTAAPRLRPLVAWLFWKIPQRSRAFFAEFEVQSN